MRPIFPNIQMPYKIWLYSQQKNIIKLYDKQLFLGHRGHCGLRPSSPCEVMMM